MCLSLWSGKTHEALLGTYALGCLWLLGLPLLQTVATTMGWSVPLPPLTINPFFLALSQSSPGSGHVESRSRISGRELGHLGALDRLGDPPAALRLHARIPSPERGPGMPGRRWGRSIGSCDRRSLGRARRWTETRCCGASAAEAVRRAGRSSSRSRPSFWRRPRPSRPFSCRRTPVSRSGSTDRKSRLASSF